jgi:hypothetical protein
MLNTRTKPACGRLREFFYLARKDAETQRNWRGPWNNAFGRHALCEFTFWRAEKNPLRLGVSPFFLFSQSRKGAKKLEKPFADWRLCESNFFFLTKTRNQPAIGRLGVN